MVTFEQVLIYLIQNNEVYYDFIRNKNDSE